MKSVSLLIQFRNHEKPTLCLYRCRIIVELPCSDLRYAVLQVPNHFQEPQPLARGPGGDGDACRCEFLMGAAAVGCQSGDEWP